MAEEKQQEREELRMLRESWIQARDEASSTIDESYLSALRAMKAVYEKAGDHEAAAAAEHKIEQVVGKDDQSCSDKVVGAKGEVVEADPFAGTEAGDLWNGGTLSMPMRWCPPGEFHMGSLRGEVGRSFDETRHLVRLTQGFWIGELAVTQKEWEEITGRTQNDQVMLAANDELSYWRDPVRFYRNQRIAEFCQLPQPEPAGLIHLAGGDNYPIYLVTWDEAKSFCRKLTARDREAGRIPDNWSYRLPTEAEWEYACRAGTEDVIYTGNVYLDHKSDIYEETHPLERIAWTGHNSKDGYPVVDEKGPMCGPREVGGKTPNEWGLKDTIGNVAEWCSDKYDEKYGMQKNEKVVDPLGGEGIENHEIQRVVRGGAWLDKALRDKFIHCRAAARVRYPPWMRRPTIGFRIVLGPGVEKVEFTLAELSELHTKYVKPCGQTKNTEEVLAKTEAEVWLPDDIVGILGMMTALQVVTIVGQLDLSDVSVLGSLHELVKCEIRGTRVRNLDGFHALQKLQKLTVLSERLEDLSGLEGLTNLRELCISSRVLRDCTPLGTLTGLKELYLNRLPVQNVEALRGLHRLEILKLDRCWRLKDLAPLAGAKSLKKLDVWDTPAENLSGFGELADLEELCLSNTRVRDLTPLAELRKLRELYCSESPVSDISPLSGITSLERVAISEDVTDLSPLADLPNLKTVDHPVFSDRGSFKYLDITKAPPSYLAFLKGRQLGSVKASREQIATLPLCQIKCLKLIGGVQDLSFVLEMTNTPEEVDLTTAYRNHDHPEARRLEEQGIRVLINGKGRPEDKRDTV